MRTSSMVLALLTRRERRRGALVLLLMMMLAFLEGVRGIVRDLRSGRQLVIWVSEIGRGVALTIGSALVRPATQPSYVHLSPIP